MQDKFQRAVKLVRQTIPLTFFNTFVLQLEANRGLLIESIKTCKTDNIARFNVWRIFLEVIPTQGTWEDTVLQIDCTRKRFLELKEEARTGIKQGFLPKEAQVSKNPLMKVVAKPEKRQTESDTFLQQQIRKDVQRTYQQLQLFQDGNILRLLANILFVWCKLNPDVSYKQGMNELLASIVYVYFSEAVLQGETPGSTVDQDLWRKYQAIMSTTHAEADIFTVFERVMQIQKEMYKTDADSQKKGIMNPNSKNNTPILQRISQIQDHRLKALDLELFRILKLQDVKTKTFMLRWIRCMHTREFSLKDSFLIWDSILLEYYESSVSRNKHQFEFIDAMCLAMFIYMRSAVITRQTANQILQIYQKYPPLKKGEYLEELIALAWSVCEQLMRQGQQTGVIVDQTTTKKLGLLEKGMFDRNYQQRDNSDHKNNTAERGLSGQKEQFTEIYQEAIQANNKHKNGEEEMPSRTGHRAEGKVELQGEELTELITILRQSIALNNDHESRQLVCKVLRILESKSSADY